MGIQLSPLNKLRLLAVGVLSLSLAAWLFSFSKTLDSFKKVGANAKMLEQLKDAPRLIEQYAQSAREPQAQEPEVAYDREILFESINTFCRNHDIQILKFHPEQRLMERGFELITNRLEVQGNFTDMVRLCWQIEQVQKIGRVASSSYTLKEDKRSKQKLLSGNFFIQHYIKTKEDALN